MAEAVKRKRVPMIASPDGRLATAAGPRAIQCIDTVSRYRFKSVANAPTKQIPAMAVVL